MKIFSGIKRVSFYTYMSVLSCILLFLNSRAQVPELILPDLPEGEQMIYFDSLLRPVEKEKASFFMHTYFHLGKDVWSLQHPWRRKYKLSWVGVQPGQPGSPVALHGTAKWCTKNYARLIAQEEFAEAQFSGQTIIYDKKQNPQVIYDYEKRFDSRPWTVYVEKIRNQKIERAGFEIYNVAAGHWETICTIGCYVTKDFRP